MIRYFVWMLAGAGCSTVAVAAPEQRLGAAPVCLYQSRSYSEGAYVCVQKSLMQVCSSDGTHAMWKPVADRNLNDRCTAPMTLDHPSEPRAHRARRHAMLRRVHPVAAGSAKCFMFNSRQYCE